MKPVDLEKELGRLSLIFSLEQRQRNPLVRRYIQKLRALLSKIREVEKQSRRRDS